MKRVLITMFVIALLSSGFVGCEQAQQAFDAVDKVKSFKDDIEKKGKEVKEKARYLLPEIGGGASGEKEKEDNDKGGTEKDG
jgi:hypothetical protein